MWMWHSEKRLGMCSKQSRPHSGYGAGIELRTFDQGLHAVACEPYPMHSIDFSQEAIMAATDGSPNLIAEISAIAQQAQSDQTTSSTLEAATVDILSLFTVRMQHHFARGPFFKELRKRLVVGGEADLADRAYQYYLAGNVLKHGSGSSYHELRAMSGLRFTIKQPDGSGVVKPEGLIDVNAASFFDGLVGTLEQAQVFLETA